MTRINANIKFKYLSDQLLRNELGEITRILTSVEQRIINEKHFNDVPKDFTLNTGHMKFFYNKCAFIIDRYIRLRIEYLNRTGNRYSPQHYEETIRRYTFIDLKKPELCNLWDATEHDNTLIKKRILERSKAYKNNHTYYGTIIENWSEFLKL
jgi:deoxyribonuclease (pyrimidine dimer)